VEEQPGRRQAAAAQHGAVQIEARCPKRRGVGWIDTYLA
jgi:hypothetical protein